MKKTKITDLRLKINKISHDYFLAERFIRSRICGFASSDSDSLNAYQKYVQRVNDAYETLDDVSKDIINNDFFYEDYPLWWTSRFSKTTYFRLKKQAMLKFLAAFND